MSGSPLWAFPGFDEDDYSEESDAEMYFDDDGCEEIQPEFDEWGNEVLVEDGLRYSDIDKTIQSEHVFDKHIRRLFYTSKNIPQEVKKENSERIKTERELQKQRSQEIHDRLIANLEAEKQKSVSQPI